MHLKNVYLNYLETLKITAHVILCKLGAKICWIWRQQALQAFNSSASQFIFFNGMRYIMRQTKFQAVAGFKLKLHLQRQVVLSLIYDSLDIEYILAWMSVL